MTSVVLGNWAFPSPEEGVKKSTTTFVEAAFRRATLRNEIAGLKPAATSNFQLRVSSRAGAGRVRDQQDSKQKAVGGKQFAQLFDF
jgi:hypothetical protein